MNVHLQLERDKAPYAGPQPFGMQPDLLNPHAIDLEAEPELWVPQAEGVEFRPLLLNVSQGYYVNLLRVRQAGVLSRHRHSGPVHAITLRGRWYYLEHDWVASAGSYAFEPPGETHTLIVPEDTSEMVTLFHVTGGYTYVDPDGRATGYEDVFTKLEAAKAHYEQTGVAYERLRAIIR